MADKATSSLPDASTITGAELLYLVQGGNSRKKDLAALLAYLLIDEDDLSSNSALKAPSQQSVKAYVDARSISLAGLVATTSGTSKSWTSLPAGIKKFEIAYKAVSFNGSVDHVIQLGDSGGLKTSGYTGGYSYVDSSTSLQNAPSSGLVIPSTSAATEWTGIITGLLMDAATNLWMLTAPGMLYLGQSSRAQSAAYVNLSGALDRIALTSSTGAATFDHGEASLSYQS